MFILLESSNFQITLVTWCEELTHLIRPWCWERLKAGGEGNNKGWDGWMASPTPWTWVWASAGSWWLTGKPGELQSMGSQGVWHQWATELPSYSRESACNVGEVGSIPGLGRSPGEGNGNPLQYSCLENPVDWPHGRKESDTTEQLTLSFSNGIS